MLIEDQRVVPVTLLAQAGASLVLAALLGVCLGKVAGWSTLLGGAAAVIPNAFLAARLLAPPAEASAATLMRAAWLGEIGKLVLTALLFATIFAVVEPLSAIAVFCGFIAAQLTIVMVPLLGSVAGGRKARTES